MDVLVERAAPALVAPAAVLRLRQAADRRGRYGCGLRGPLRRAVALAVGGRAVVRESWRPGLRGLEYRAPDGRRTDFQVCDAGAARTARLLRVPDPADLG
ncbi:hypothetical protein [Streptomyces sp. NPDC085540]|uniref:hypothetical protein n=1 Tax=Streptomyces sp. NPDC085540 TaxID=3365730 RepID=UPI0037D1B2EE